MLLPPPGLLTTVSDEGTSLWATRMRSTVRAVLSLLPPGADVTTISTFFCGDQPCPPAVVPNQKSASPISARPNLLAAPYQSGSSVTHGLLQGTPSFIVAVSAVGVPPGVTSPPMWGPCSAPRHATSHASRSYCFASPRSTSTAFVSPYSFSSSFANCAAGMKSLNQ